MLPTSLLLWITFPLLSSATQILFNSPPRPNNSLSFQLRHIHAVTNTRRIVFADVQPGSSLDGLLGEDNEYAVMTKPIRTHRPSSFASHERARLKAFRWDKHFKNDGIEELIWSDEEIIGPNVTDRETLLQLAKMTNNAYADGKNGNGREWYEIGKEWNTVRVLLPGLQ